MRLLVHTSHAGGIIGRGGQRIRELRDVSHHAIIRDEYFNLKLTPLANQSCNKGLHPTMPSRKSFNFSLQIILLIHLLSLSKQSTERVCALQGPAPIVVDAIKTVLDVIVATPVKGVVKLYDPFNFDVYMAPEYGGFAEPQPTNNNNNNNNSRKIPRGPTGSARRPPPMEHVMPNSRDSWQMRGPQMPPPPPDWGRSGPGIGNHYDDRRGPPMGPSSMYPRWPGHGKWR